MNGQGTRAIRTGRMRSAQAGLTLVEMMVAMVLGLFIVLALATLLISVNRNNTELSRTNVVIENGRFAVQLLEADFAHAGYWGGFVPQFDDLTRASGTYTADAPTAIPDPCLPVASWNAAYLQQLIGLPIQVYTIDATGTIPAIGVDKCNPADSTRLIKNPQPNTHVLFVRYAARCEAGSSTDEDCTAEAGAVYFQYGRCATEAAPTYTLAAAVDASLNNFTRLNRGCNALAATRGTAANQRAPAYKLVQHMYYIRDFSVAAGDGIPTLMRSTFRATGGVSGWSDPQAMIEGIEGFRVDLGLDNLNRLNAALTAASFNTAPAWQTPTDLKVPTNRGDGSPDQYVQCTAATPCTAFQLMNTSAIRLNVLVRALTQSEGHTDTSRVYTLGETGAGGICLGPSSEGCVATLPSGYKRQIYHRAIRLTNISMRRELPP